MSDDEVYLLNSVKGAARDVEIARETLDLATARLAVRICEAHPRWSFQSIADAAGLSKSRVHQIVQEGAQTS